MTSLELGGGGGGGVCVCVCVFILYGPQQYCSVLQYAAVIIPKSYIILLVAWNKVDASNMHYCDF